MFNLIKDINAIRLTSEWALLRFSDQNPWSAFGKRCLALLWTLTRSVKHAPSEFMSLAKATPAQLTFFSSTQNQTKALAPISEQLEDVRWIWINQAERKREVPIRFPTILVSIFTILTLPISTVYLATYLVGMNKKNDSFRERLKTIAYSFDEILRSYGYFVAAAVVIQRHGIETLVMSNDHNSINRAFAYAGRKKGITTIYVQHAPVSSLFPRLNFSLALLDGKVSAEIYRAKLSDTKIEIVGASRFDQKFQDAALSRQNTEKRISLCLNKLDSKSTFVKYIRGLHKRGWDVVVRPHPAMSGDELVFLPKGVPIDRDDIVAHLKRVHFLMAGSSGVLLDAFMAGVIPLMATDLSSAQDYYGFLKKNAVYPLKLTDLDKLDQMYTDLTLEPLSSGMANFNAAISCSKPYNVAHTLGLRITREILLSETANNAPDL